MIYLFFKRPTTAIYCFFSKKKAGEIQRFINNLQLLGNTWLFRRFSIKSREDTSRMPKKLSLNLFLYAVNLVDAWDFAMTIEDLWMPHIPFWVLMACRYRAWWYLCIWYRYYRYHPYRDTITQECRVTDFLRWLLDLRLGDTAEKWARACRSDWQWS